MLSGSLQRCRFAAGTGRNREGRGHPGLMQPGQLPQTLAAEDYQRFILSFRQPDGLLDFLSDPSGWSNRNPSG